jgi:hypothetical protein
MNKISLLTALVFCCLFSFGQNENKADEMFSLDKKSESVILHAPRLDSIMAKLKKAQLAASKSATDYSFFHAIKLPDFVFNALTVKEKFVYAFKYPEQFTQNCAMYSFDKPDAPFLHASLPFEVAGLIVSKRQDKGLMESRNSTISYLTEIIKLPINTRNEYKQEMVKLKAFECLPDLTRKYDASKIKDNYILTTGLLLMKNDSFPPFVSSDIYKRFYGENGHWRDKMDLTETIKTTIIDLIDKYYKWKLGQ